MRLQDEINHYSSVQISPCTGEIELWDNIIFPNVIRKRQLIFINSVVNEVKPRRILDWGCGAGWLSKILYDKRCVSYTVVGVDASSDLINVAHNVNSDCAFAVADCTRLPFRDHSFDCVVGSAILHHLDIETALKECKRVMSQNGVLILMEPNKLNPVAAIGRVFIHEQTKDEKPITPVILTRALLNTGLAILSFQTWFPLSFSLSYLAKICGVGSKPWLRYVNPFIANTEHVIEKLPIIKNLGYEIMVVVKKV